MTTPNPAAAAAHSPTQTFTTLRAANLARLPQFRNRHGQLAHSKPDGSDWSPAQWLQAVIGELGEYANLRKKHERGDIDGDVFKREATDELADVATYLDILAAQLGVDLEAAIASKFNRVSERVGSDVRLVNSHAALVAQRDALLAALGGMDALVERAQDVVRKYLPPDSGVENHEALSDLIHVLDCPEQHAAQQQAKAAIAKCREEKV